MTHSTGEGRRERLVEEVLDELTAHSPADIVHAMRRLPTGPLSLVHLNVLVLLSDGSHLPMRALAEELDVSQASATGIVDRMERRGLVERTRDDADRRVVRVALTDAGHRLVATLSAQRRGRLAQLLGDLTDDELEGLLRGTRALASARARLAAGKVATR